MEYECFVVDTSKTTAIKRCLDHDLDQKPRGRTLPGPKPGMRGNTLGDMGDLSTATNTSQDVGKQRSARNTVFAVLCDSVPERQEVCKLGLEALIMEHFVGDLDGALRK